MLGVAGVLAQSILVPDVWWYDAALHLPAGLGPVNLGSTLAIQFLMMHWVEVRRWQDIRKPGSVSEDPIFRGNKLPAGEVGYPGA
jgi:light-harvesting complex I chlorophyll a/b binding protein 4